MHIPAIGDKYTYLILPFSVMWKTPNYLIKMPKTGKELAPGSTKRILCCQTKSQYES
jgi:hypothetical protein